MRERLSWERAMSALSTAWYGLRYFETPREIRLLQIGGGGRLLLGDGSKRWWSKPPRLTRWEVYVTDRMDGQVYENRQKAEDVLSRLV
jgi:hypothetical protein